MDISQTVTILIKTFERPACVRRLVESIRTFYPTIRIVVVDDSRIPITGLDANIYTMPFDSGVSAGRNLGVSKIMTPYTFLCDDDCIFTRDTSLEGLIEMLERKHIDMLGLRASGVDFQGTYVIEGKTIYCKPEPLEVDVDVKLYDYIPNLFIALTEVLREFPWDNTLKVGEHFAYFFYHRHDIQVGYTERFSLIHAHESTDAYQQYRGRAVEYVRDFLRRSGYSRRIDAHGVIEV